jgi:hypothetical protein
MSLEQCGRNFVVRQRPRRAWLLPVVSAIILAFAVLSKRWVLPLTGWALVAGRLRRATQVDPVRVAMDRVEHGSRAIAFARARAVRRSAALVIVESPDGELVLDATLVGARELLVRHLEARMLLARLPGRRPKSERVALEALYVFDAEAVRIYKRRAVEILRGEGPWVVGRKERVYVRRAVRIGYRMNARPDAIEIGALES